MVCRCIYEIFEEQVLNNMSDAAKDQMQLTFTLPAEQAKDLKRVLCTNNGFEEVCNLVLEPTITEPSRRSHGAFWTSMWHMRLAGGQKMSKF